MSMIATRQIDRYILMGVTVMSLLFLGATASWAYIDRKFTPIDLVRQSDVIVVGTIQAMSQTDMCKLSDVEAIKGKSFGAAILTFASPDKDQIEDLRRLLATTAKSPALFFAATQAGETKGFLLVHTTWLNVEPRGAGEWAIKSFAPNMSAVYAGGSDMLALMARYILADPNATVPVAVGTSWAAWSKIAKLDGKIAGMAVVEIAGDETPCLFVASDGAEDKLFRPKKNAEEMEDVTAAARLGTHSRQFVWMDVNRDGLADLVTWNGRTIAARIGARDGTFAPADAARTFDMREPCLKLSPAGTSARGGARVLVSTARLPFLLEWASGAGGWSRTDLPPPEKDAGSSSPCIVADLDNDGWLDVLQPRETAGLLWRGGSNGFQRPARSPVAAPKGPARFALGDFNTDGRLDIFVSGSEENHLWENDGAGGFRDAIQRAGSLTYKAPAGVSDCAAADLNRDGRPDLALCYTDGTFVYHFNRGYRCFGEEGGLQLSETPNPPPGVETGVATFAIADWNGDGSEDLAAGFADGNLYVFYSESANVAGLHVRLAKGAIGPATVSTWQGKTPPVCLGTNLVGGHSPESFFGLRRPGECTLRWSEPGRPSLSRTVAATETTRTVLLKEP